MHEMPDVSAPVPAHRLPFRSAVGVKLGGYRVDSRHSASLQRMSASAELRELLQYDVSTHC
jgi:hypothetical protein